MAFDAAGNLWATTGGGPLLQLDPQTGAILGQFGDSLTQALAIQPGTGLIYVSSGGGIEIFNPATQTFTQFSDLRVGSLAFAPDGTLWAVTWPEDQDDVVEFVPNTTNPNPITPQYHPQLMLTLDSPVESIAFGLPGTALAGLLFVSHDEEAQPGAGTELTMVDLATLQTVAVATGGTRGDEIKTTADGRVLISQSHEVDVLSPVMPPLSPAATRPPVRPSALPLGTIGIVFDHDMDQGGPTDSHSVLDPANYPLIGDAAGPIAIKSVAYDAASRTAILSFDAIEPGGYTMAVGTTIESTDGLALARPYSAHFVAIEDLSQVVISFTNGRANAANKTYSYSVTVTNNGPTPLLPPFELSFDSLQPVNDADDRRGEHDRQRHLWVNLSSDVPGGKLFAGQTTTGDRHVREPVGPGALVQERPAGHAGTQRRPDLRLAAGDHGDRRPDLQFTVTAHDPNR